MNLRRIFRLAFAREQLAQAGLVFSGTSPDDQLVEFFIPGEQQEDGDPVRYVYEHGVVGWVLLGIVVLALAIFGIL